MREAGHRLTSLLSVSASRACGFSHISAFGITSAHLSQVVILGQLAPC